MDISQNLGRVKKKFKSEEDIIDEIDKLERKLKDEKSDEQEKKFDEESKDEMDKIRERIKGSDNKESNDGFDEEKKVEKESGNNKRSIEDHGSEGSDRENKIEKRISNLEDKMGELESNLIPSEDVEKLREQLIQEETHETERFDKLQSRLENLELDLQNETIHEKAAQKRVEKLEERMEKLEEENDMSQRFEELEQEVLSISEEMDNRIEKKLEDKSDGGNEIIEKLTDENVFERLESLENKYEDVDGQFDEDRLDRVEGRVSDIEDKMSHIMADMKDLAKLVKKQN